MAVNKEYGGSPEEILNLLNEKDDKIEQLEQQLSDLQQWKTEMLAVWGPVWDFLQNDKSLLIGTSMSAVALERLKKYADLQAEKAKEFKVLFDKASEYKDKVWQLEFHNKKLVEALTRISNGNDDATMREWAKEALESIKQS